MGAPVTSRPHLSRTSGLQQVLEVARNPDKCWVLATASRPGMTHDEDRRANAVLRQELRAAGLDYWLIFAEWRDLPHSPNGEWRRFAFVEGTDHPGFQSFVSRILKRHAQPAALVGDGLVSIVRNAGEATELGRLDILSSVAVYGQALEGTGTLTMVRAFVPVGVLGVDVKVAAENRTSSAAAR